MINYCSSAMFGAEITTTLVMIVFSAALALFIGWVAIRAADKKMDKKAKDE